MLTAKDTEVNKAAGFDLGANDYVTKPFTWHELLTWIQAAPLLPAAHGGSTHCVRRGRTRYA